MVILPLDSKQATLSTSGGKGANLARLVQAGFPIPDGFLLTTAAYHAFVAANDLSAIIEAQVGDLLDNDLDALHGASAIIRASFAAGVIPEETAALLQATYAKLGNSDSRGCAVAVRSSATAEDLPDLSFAGQQDTFLNVVGQEALLTAVKKCWSSLWTARAIGYRQRNKIAQDGIALAVIIQMMVPSETSGVLFTANPLNGKRTEMVIDATFGLGEALVSGQIEPDQYLVQAADGRILKKTLGSKALVIREQAGGGTISESADAGDQQALPDPAITELAAFGREIETLFHSPQDIEWAWAHGKMWLLQSRPITSLYPLIEGVNPETQPVRALFSFGAVQGMLDPMTPVGQDSIRTVFAGAARLFGFDLTADTQPVIYSAGERLFGDLSALIRHPIGQRVMVGFMRFVEPGSASVIKALTEDPRFKISRGWFKFSTVHRVVRFMVSIAAQYIRTMRHPERARLQFQEDAETMVADFSRRMKTAESLAVRIALSEAVTANAFPFLAAPFCAADRRRNGFTQYLGPPGGRCRLGQCAGGDPGPALQRDHRDGPGAVADGRVDQSRSGFKALFHGGRWPNVGAAIPGRRFATCGPNGRDRFLAAVWHARRW